MARGRFISESIAKDVRLNSLSVEAELVYLMTIPHLDRDGLIEGDPDALWGTVCPKRRALLDRMAGFIQEWAKAGLVLCYDTDEEIVLWFKGFAKNQIGLRYDRETPSRFPLPPGHYRSAEGIVSSPPPPPNLPPAPEPPQESDEQPEANLSSADSIRQESGNVPAEVPLMSAQVQGQVEVKDQVQDQVKAAGGKPPPAATIDPDVARVWEAWNANMPGTKSQVITDGVNALLDTYSAAEIVEAIAIACRRHKRYLSYIEGILEKGVFSEKPVITGGDYRPPGNGRMSPADKSQAAASELRAMLKAQGKEAILHG